MKQAEMNVLCADMAEFCDSVEAYFTGKPERLYNCQAWVYRYGNRFFLRSYNTFIAAYDPAEETVFDFLRYAYGYTATSAQHIGKFKKWLAENGFRIIQLCTYRE